MAATLGQADAFLLSAKGMGGFADWEFEDFSVGSTCSGLSDVISLQSSDCGSPIPHASEYAPPLESLQSFTSAMSPFPAAPWGPADRQQQGLITSSVESMDWARPAAAAAATNVACTVGEKKDETRSAKRVRRREQQKVAQQRYRQKQRHWAVEMEVKVEELAKQHDTIRAEQTKLSAKRASLENNVQRMEAALAEKSAQAAALRQRLGAQQPAYEMAEPRAVEPQQAAEDAARRLSGSVAAIRAYVDRHLARQGVSPQSIQADELPGLLAEYEDAAVSYEADSPAQAADGVKPEGKARSATAMEGIVKALRLTPVQRQTLAWIRERQLKKMVALADARRELNMRAMSQMLPSLRMTAALLEEQLGSLPIDGGMTSTTDAAELDATIDAVKANIKEERQALAELEDLVMHRALTPLQHAVFIVESYPARPDGFAMVNAIVDMPGVDKMAVRTRRGSH